MRHLILLGFLALAPGALAGTAALANDAPSGHDDVPAVAIVVPVASFVTVFAVVGAILYAGMRRDQQRHLTLRAMVEKGLELPPGLLTVSRGSDLRKGVVLLGAGVGLAIALRTIDGAAPFWGAGLVPALLGLAYLVAWRLEKKHSPPAG